MLPLPFNFWKREKNNGFSFKKKKKKVKTVRATGLKSESIMPITILHNRLDLWYGIIHTFFNICLTINF